MKFWNFLFDSIKKIHHWGISKTVLVTNYGLVFLLSIILFAISNCLLTSTKIEFFFILSKFFAFFIIFEFLFILFFKAKEIRNNIIKPNLKSYICFLFSFCTISYGIVNFIPINLIHKVLQCYLFSFVFIIYGIGTIIWFAYFIYLNTDFAILKLLLKKLTIIVTILQLIISANSNFYLSLILIAYLYIDYLIETVENNKSRFNV